jgi:hypothetical protein
MAPLNLPKVTVFGRPVKPVALGLGISMCVIAWAAFTDVGVLDGSRWADLLGLGAFTVAGTLFVAWYKRSQSLAEAGLLMSFFVWVTRFMLVILVGNNPISQEGLWLSLAWVVISGGAYLLERADPNTSPKKWET